MVNDVFRVNENDRPFTTCAVVVISSPKNTGTVPAPAAPCDTDNVPALWSANTTVYPAFVFPAGEVVGEIETCPHSDKLQ